LNETLSTVKFSVRTKRIKNKKRLTNHSFTPNEIMKKLAETKIEQEYYKKKVRIE
jgi:hypothetical protein